MDNQQQFVRDLFGKHYPLKSSKEILHQLEQGTKLDEIIGPLACGFAFKSAMYFPRLDPQAETGHDTALCGHACRGRPHEVQSIFCVFCRQPICGCHGARSSGLLRHVSTKCKGLLMAQRDKLAEAMHQLDAADFDETRPLSYPCTWNGCAYVSRFRDDLVKHARVHTGEKPFRCRTCGYQSAQKGNLVSHRRTIHGDDIPNQRKNNVRPNNKSGGSSSSRKKKLGKPMQAEPLKLPASNTRQNRHRRTDYKPPHADAEQSSEDEDEGNDSDIWQTNDEEVESEYIGLSEDEDEDVVDDEDKDEEHTEEADVHKTRTERKAGDEEDDVEDANGYAQIHLDNRDESDSEGQTVTGYSRTHPSPVASTSTHRPHLEVHNGNERSRVKVPLERKGPDSRSPTSGPASPIAALFPRNHAKRTVPVLSGEKKDQQLQDDRQLDAHLSEEEDDTSNDFNASLGDVLGTLKANRADGGRPQALNANDILPKQASAVLVRSGPTVIHSHPPPARASSVASSVDPLLLQQEQRPSKASAVQQKRPRGAALKLPETQRSAKRPRVEVVSKGSTAQPDPEPPAMARAKKGAQGVPKPSSAQPISKNTLTPSGGSRHLQPSGQRVGHLSDRRHAQLGGRSHLDAVSEDPEPENVASTSASATRNEQEIFKHPRPRGDIDRHDRLQEAHGAQEPEIGPAQPEPSGQDGSVVAAGSSAPSRLEQFRLQPLPEVLQPFRLLLVEAGFVNKGRLLEIRLHRIKLVIEYLAEKYPHHFQSPVACVNLWERWEDALAQIMTEAQSLGIVIPKE